MRTKHSINNISISIISQIIIVLLGFIARKIFLDSLGASYLGINGLLTNVLSMLVLVEGGIAISIVYNLYKPLAEDNKEKVIALIQLYKKAYGILAIITLIISVCLYPLLDHLMKDEVPVPHIEIIYSIFVAKSILSYLNAHKWSLITADQRGYVLTRVDLLFQVITMITRIIVLITTENYVFYLILELLVYLIQNMVNGRIVNKRYPYIKTKQKYAIDKDTKNNIIKNVKAMFLHNIGGFLVFSTDNILISSFIGVATVGLYSNYTMITQQLSALVNSILGGIGSSVGNLIATESNDKSYSIFKISYFVNFWIYSFSIIFLFNLLEPFISWWLGDGYLLDKLTFVFILINFYLLGMRTAIGTFKNKAGLFTQDQYIPLIEGLLNLIASLVFLKYFGLSGIFMGTALSTIATVCWTQPCIVYKHVFNRPVRSYFKNYGYYLLLTISTCCITTICCNYFVVGDTFTSLLVRGLFCLLIPNFIYVVVFYKSNEFQYLKSIIFTLMSDFKKIVFSSKYNIAREKQGS
ncbi:lipopolysaccharide biosynthesis protein [Paenibacillus sp. sgz302251]|uniref:lipopolysaccharide biosynthesis protein n=1 Tax=Paenibacillus sp. sgz302251 TaxID=3414493 RepID=UPI003C7A372E